MAFDPEQDGWRLSEAIMRLSDPEALTKLAHVCSASAETNHRPVLPRWWIDEFAPAPAGKASSALMDLKSLYGRYRLDIERAFSDQLESGKIIGWARRDTPVAPYQRLPSDAWRALSARRDYWDWHGGAIRVEDARYRSLSPPVIKPGLRAASKQGPDLRARGGHASPLRQRETDVVLRLYSVRIQPPDSFRRIGKSASEAQCRAWLIALMKAHPTKPSPKTALMQEAVQRFGIARAAATRAWRDAVKETGSTWNRAGVANQVGESIRKDQAATNLSGAG